MNNQAEGCEYIIWKQGRVNDYKDYYSTSLELETIDNKCLSRTSKACLIK